MVRCNQEAFFWLLRAAEQGSVTGCGEKLLLMISVKTTWGKSGRCVSACLGVFLCSSGSLLPTGELLEKC